MMANRAVKVELTDAERKELESLGRSHRTAQAWRARIVLAAAEGLANKEIAAKLKMTQATVGKWRRRFAERRLDGLYDEPRPGAPRRIGDDDVADVIRRTLEETPPGATHWSLSRLAPRTVWKILTQQEICPKKYHTTSNGGIQTSTGRWLKCCP